jgi:hypothetical protein
MANVAAWPALLGVVFTRSIAPLFPLDTMKVGETYENNDM